MPPTSRSLGAVLAVIALIAGPALAGCSGDDAAGEHDAPDGSAGNGGTSGDGDTVDLLGVPATFTGFSTLGAPRSGNGVTLRGDGFELGERRCSTGAPSASTRTP